jgi:hypothetical protein
MTDPRSVPGGRLEISPVSDLVRLRARTRPRRGYVRFVESRPKTASSRVGEYKVKAEGVTGSTGDRELRDFELNR